MEREGLIDDTCARICEIKAELARIQETIAGLYTSLNGLQGDGSGNLQIIGGPGVGVETIDGNRIRLTAGIVDTDPEPTEGSTDPVQSGGTYDMIMTEHAERIAADTAETAARSAADNALGDRINNVGSAANPVQRATTAGTADAVPASGVTGVLPIAHGGTGSATQNFVDLSTNQSAAGVKTWTSNQHINTAGSPHLYFRRLDADVSMPSQQGDAGTIPFEDKNGVRISAIYNYLIDNGRGRLIVRVRNSDGSTKQIYIAEGNII